MFIMSIANYRPPNKTERKEIFEDTLECCKTLDNLSSAAAQKHNLYIL
jgi:hypothetical protein